MKLTFCLVLTVALALSSVACNNNKKSKIIDEDKPVAVTVPGDVEPRNDSMPKMEIEVRGMGFILTVGEGVVGHYDEDENYWVCTDDEPIFETSPDNYGDKKYTVLKIRDKDGMGLVDENGKIVVLPMYASLQLGFSNGFCKVANQDNKHGLIAESGKIVVLPMYASLQLGFSNGFCKVANQDNKHGLIAESGKIVLPVIYDDIWSENISDGLIMASKNNLQGFLDLQGKTVIPFEYETLVQAGEGLIWFMQKPQQWGCINYKNEIIVKAEFTHTTPFINGKAKAQKKDGQDYFIYTNGKVEECD